MPLCFRALFNINLPYCNNNKKDDDDVLVLYYIFIYIYIYNSCSVACNTIKSYLGVLLCWCCLFGGVM